MIVNTSCSASHALLAEGKVDPMHPDLLVDPLNILRPPSKLAHQLPLVIFYMHNDCLKHNTRERERAPQKWQFPEKQLILQVSAYSSFARMGVGPASEQQKKRMDPTTNEPLFTSCTRDFIGTLDYIFYTGEIVLSILILCTSKSLLISTLKRVLPRMNISFVAAVADSLTVESLLELLDEESLRKDTALPSPEWSSDHIALLAEFHCNPRPRR